MNCDECGSTHYLETPQGDYVCRDCGLVLDKVISVLPEWKFYTPDQVKNIRCGPFHVPGQFDLSTTIRGSKDSNRAPLSPANYILFRRLRKLHGHTTKDPQGILRQTIEGIAQGLHITGCIEDAISLARKFDQSKSFKGYSFFELGTVFLFLAARSRGIQMSIGEILRKLPDLKKTNIMHLIHVVSHHTNLSYKNTPLLQYIPRIASSLSIDSQGQRQVREILMRAQRKGITQGKNPRGCVGAAIYIYSRRVGKKLTQKQIATNAAITEVSLRQLYRKISPLAPT